MVHEILSFAAALINRFRRCALCGSDSQKLVAAYGSYKFCSPDHEAEWRHHKVM